MKSLAVVTICKIDNTNHGNALQNFAVKKYFEGMGFSVDNLCFIDKKGRYLELMLKGFMHKLTKYRFSKNESYWKERIPKLTPFEKYYKKNCPHKYVDNIDGLSEKYDYFAIGSDQVWNAAWYSDKGIMSQMYLLTFARKEQKICVAPSFGNPSIPDKWKDFFKEYLVEFPKLNVREKSGQLIVKELTGIDADLMIDPTLWFDRNEWYNHANKPKNIDTECDYVLTYFLGGINSKRSKLIDDVCNNQYMKRYDLLKIENRNLLTIDPSEFVYLIKNAKLVVTDSFHACVFSFLMGVPFVVCEREGANNEMFSRIETLLEIFKIQRKDETDMLKETLFDCDYSIGHEILREKQEEVRKYYNKILNIPG